MIRERRREKAKVIIERINTLLDLHDKQQNDKRSFQNCKIKGCEVCDQIKALGNELNEVQNKLSLSQGKKFRLSHHEPLMSIWI